MESSTLLTCLRAPALCEELEDVSMWLDNCKAVLQEQDPETQVFHRPEIRHPAWLLVMSAAGLARSEPLSEFLS